jgi:uncharacterized membrane protein
MRNMKLWMSILWVLVVALVVGRLAATLFSSSLFVALILVMVAFPLIHGAIRYRWSGVLTFLVICLVVSNILENASILTGFPFGHYHYTDALGPKLFLVPMVIGPAYFATGYLAWVLAVVLIGDVRREGSWFTTFVVPLIASAFMVMWDLSFDPTSSTRAPLDLGAGRWLLRRAADELPGVVFHCVLVPAVVCALPPSSQRYR